MNLRLHNEKGVNPHVSFCRRCGADVGLLLIGAFDKKFTCDSCNTMSIGSSHCIKCRADHRSDNNGQVEKIGDNEKLPDACFCDACEKEGASRHSRGWWDLLQMCRLQGYRRHQAFPLLQQMSEKHTS